MNNYNNIIIFINIDHSGSIFKKLVEQFCTPQQKKPYVAFELKIFDTFWCQKTDAAGRQEYFYKWSKGQFVKINNKEYAPCNINYFSTREELKNYFDSLSQNEKERVITYNPFLKNKKGYSDLI